MSNLDDFIEECLREHNAKRLLHNAPPLKHSHALDRSAQEWAEELINEETIKNSALSSRGEIGESISMRTSTSLHVDISGLEVVSQWYTDNKNYNYESCSGPAGNFTQVVWKSTREVGFGKARASGKCIVVAHYRPPGNLRGRYKENVHPASSSLATKVKGQEDPNSDTKRSEETTMVTEDDEKTYIVHREVIESTTLDGRDDHIVVLAPHHIIPPPELHKVTVGCERAVCAEINTMTKHKTVGNGSWMPLSPNALVEVKRSVNEVYKETPKAGEQKGALPVVDFPSDKNGEHDDGRRFALAVTEAHNSYRSQHGSPPLTLDNEMCSLAQKWAEHLLTQEHISNSGYKYRSVRLGENVFSRWSNSVAQCNSQELLDIWYKESVKYTYNSEPESIQGIGSFTQLVWNGSRLLGVGCARQPRNISNSSSSTARTSSKLIIVCFYYPPGNITGEFVLNVKAPVKSSSRAAEEKPAQ